MKLNSGFCNDIVERAEKEPEPILAWVLGRRAWSQEELMQLRNADRQKLEIAERLRGVTTTSSAWRALPLLMGSPRCVANCLRSERP
jgi:hypothetical protein